MRNRFLLSFAMAWFALIIAFGAILDGALAR